MLGGKTTETLKKTVAAFALGVVYTYILFLPTVLTLEKIKWPNADPSWFWALYAPFGVVFLLSRDAYKYGMTETLFQELVAVPCLIVGMGVAFYLAFRRRMK